MKELFVFVEDEATEAQIKDIAWEILILSPAVIGVYRHPDHKPDERVTHASSEKTQ